MMFQGPLAVLIAVVLAVADTAVTGPPPRASSGPGLMRTKDGKPVLFPFPPLRRAAVPTPKSRADLKGLLQRHLDELLTQEMKLQMDKTNLEKFLTDILLWRKAMFDRPRR